MLTAYRGFAHANPVAYTLTYAPRRGLRCYGTIRALLGYAPARGHRPGRPGDALPAARTIVAWANGFITMELAGAFRLGGDIEQAWDFGRDRILTAVQRGDDGLPPH